MTSSSIAPSASSGVSILRKCNTSSGCCRARSLCRSRRFTGGATAMRTGSARTIRTRLDRYRSDWRDGWTSAATAFQTFEAPLVELPLVDDTDSEAIGRVCAIFEKLNSTGVDLSVYDLLTARLYRSGIRLHDLWEEACKSHHRLRAWSGGKADEHKFGVLVLRTLALLRGLDPKPRILIDLSPIDFEKDWRRAAGAIERALRLITLVGQDGFGVFAEKWLPGFGLVPILAALRAEIEDRRSARPSERISGAGTGATCSWNAIRAQSRASPGRTISR